MTQNQNFKLKLPSSITLGLIIALSVGYVLSWLTVGNFSPIFLFELKEPGLWNWFTYPFVSIGNGNGVIWFALSMWIFYTFGTSVEKDLGHQKYGILLFASVVLPAIFLWLGGLVVTRNMSLYGPDLLLAAVIVTWGFRSQQVPIMLYGILPIKGLWIAILAIVGILFTFGTGNPLLGVFAIIHLGIAAMFGMDRIPFFRYSPKPVFDKDERIRDAKDREYLDAVKKREQERDERERLRKLFEASVRDDNKNDR